MDWENILDNFAHQGLSDHKKWYFMQTVDSLESE